MKKHLLLKFCSIALWMIFATGLSAQTFYSVCSGTCATFDPTLAANWNSSRTGGGTTPPTPVGNTAATFVVQGTGTGGTGVPHNLTFTTAWSPAAVITLEIEGGASLTSNTAITLGTTSTFKIDAGGTYIHNNTTTASSSIFKGIENFDATSTVQINAWGSNAVNNSVTASAVLSGTNYNFGNLTINGGNTGAINANSNLCAGNLTFTSAFTGTFTFRSASNTTYAVQIGGNLVIHGGTITVNSGSAGGCTVTVKGNTTVDNTNNATTALVLNTASSLSGGISGIQTVDATFLGTNNTTSLINWNTCNGCGTGGGPQILISGNFSKSGAVTFNSSGSDGGVGFVFNDLGVNTQLLSYTGTNTDNKTNYVVSSTSIAQLTTDFTLGTNSSFTFSGNGLLDCQTYVLKGGASSTFNLSAGATLKTANANGVYSGIIGSISNAINSTTFNAAANYIFNGTVTQNTNFKGSPQTMHNLTIDNTAGVATTGVTLTSPITLNTTGVLAFSAGADGVLSTTTTNLPSVTNNAAGGATGGSNTAFVSGPLKWTLASGTAYVFPIGKGNNYYPFYMTPTGSAPVMQAESFNTNSGGTAGTGLLSISNTEYWSALLTGGTYTTGVVGLGRSTPVLGSNNVIGYFGNTSSTSAAQTYAAVGGTVAGTAITGSNPIGAISVNNHGYFVLGEAGACVPPSPPVLTIVNNCGNSTVTASGVTGTVTWSDAGSGNPRTITSGSLTATQSNGGCASTNSNSVTANPTPTPGAPALSVVDNCGNSVVTATGVTGTLTWSDAGSGNPRTVSSGSFTATQTVNGCTSGNSNSVTANPTAGPAAPTLTVVNNCNNSTITASGYTGTLTWSDAGSGNPRTVASGSFTVTQTIGGCTSGNSNSVTASPTSSAAPTLTIVDNCGSSTITATGVTGTLNWSDAGSGNPRTVASGTFTATQTTAGCTSGNSNSVTANPGVTPGAPTLAVVNNCSTSTITATGVTGTLTWSDAGSGNPRTVSSGSFTVTQTVNGCTSGNSNSVTANPAPITAPVLTIVDNCSNSTITATGVAGTLTWSDAGSGNPRTVTSGTFTATQTVSGCTSTSSNSVTANPTGPPAAPTVTVVDNCANSTITATGVTGTLNWSDGVNGNPRLVTSGSFTATQTLNGCVSSTSNSVTANPKAVPLALTLSIADNCGTSTLVAAGVTGTITWSDAGSGNPRNVPAGTYLATQTVNGCSSGISNAVTANPLPLPTVTFSFTQNPVCEDALPVALTGGPSGGTFSGPGVSAATFDPTGLGPGNHVVTYTYTGGNGCTDSAHATIIISTCTGVNDVKSDEMLQVYPNPLESGRWEMVCGTEFLGGTMELFDADGRVVYKSEVKNLKSQIDLNAAKGIYMMKISSQQKSAWLKLIKL